MPRFVILEHDHPVVHWDLMLEAEGMLQTWRLAREPERDQAIDAAALGDHRIAYLDYEGPVSGDRGTVKRWDAGLFTEQAESTPTARILSVHGTRIQGRVRLEQVECRNWRFVWMVA